MNIENYAGGGGSSQSSTPYSPYGSTAPKPTTPHSPYTPTNYHTPATPQSPYTPSTPRAYQSPHQPTAAYTSPSALGSGSPGYHPLANVTTAPPAPPPPLPSEMGNDYNSMGNRPSRSGPKATDKPAIPDAVLNMASKGQPDKKPFAYAADMNEIKEHREKVRRK